MGEVCSEYYEKLNEIMVPEAYMADDQPFLKPERYVASGNRAFSWLEQRWPPRLPGKPRRDGGRVAASLVPCTEEGRGSRTVK